MARHPVRWWVQATAAQGPSRQLVSGGGPGDRQDGSRRKRTPRRSRKGSGQATSVRLNVLFQQTSLVKKKKIRKGEGRGSTFHHSDQTQSSHPGLGVAGRGPSAAAPGGRGLRAAGLEAVLGLRLPAAQLVLRPRVLQLQLPLLGLRQERDRRRAEPCSQASLPHAKGTQTPWTRLPPTQVEGALGKQRRRSPTRAPVLRRQTGTLTWECTHDSSTSAPERTCGRPGALTGQVGQTPAGHQLVTTPCGHTRLCVWDLRNPHREAAWKVPESCRP